MPLKRSTVCTTNKHDLPQYLPPAHRKGTLIANRAEAEVVMGLVAYCRPYSALLITHGLPRRQLRLRFCEEEVVSLMHRNRWNQEPIAGSSVRPRSQGCETATWALDKKNGQDSASQR